MFSKIHHKLVFFCKELLFFLDLRFLNVPFASRDTAAEDPAFQATIRDGLTFIWGLDSDFDRDCLQSSSTDTFEVGSLLM